MSFRFEFEMAASETVVWERVRLLILGEKDYFEVLSIGVAKGDGFWVGVLLG